MIDRNTILVVKSNDQLHYIKFDSEAYEAFFNLIPEKEYVLSDLSNNTSKNDMVFNDLKKLAEFRDNGIISDDEFKEKKEVILSRIK